MDGDMLSFVLAAACEKKTVVVTHKPTKTKKEFKNKTEFQGRSKKTIGGWLGDLNKSRVEREQKPFTLEEFDFEEVYVPDSIENCLHSVKQKISNVEEHLGVSNTHIVLGTGNNFRHDLLMPTRYKANREGVHKPLLLAETRRYLVDIRGAEVCTGIEADDRLAMYQFEGHKAFKATGEYSTVVSAVDKDARQTDGLLFNPTTSNGGKFVYPEPLAVDGLGELYLNPKGEPKGHGRAWLYYQILNGDDTDGYNPTKGFIRGFGAKSSFDGLIDCKTDKDYWQRIVEHYLEWFPQGLQYEAWDGTEMDITAVEWIQMMTTCAFMQRFPNDELNVCQVLDKMEITYD